MNQTNCVIAKQYDNTTLCFQTVKEYQEYVNSDTPSIAGFLSLLLGVTVIVLGGLWFINKYLR
jgi:hypothetical protein